MRHDSKKVMNINLVSNTDATTLANIFKAGS